MDLIYSGRHLGKFHGPAAKLSVQVMEIGFRIEGSSGFCVTLDISA